MIDITVKFLGGLRQDLGKADADLSFPEGATVADLETKLRALGLDLDTANNIVVLNQRGLYQWPPEQRLDAEDEVIVFPHIAGGKCS